MKYEVFEKKVQKAGLTAKWRHSTHWQILGGRVYSVVNVWPNSKRGFRFQTGSQKAQGGTLAEAIALAGPMGMPKRATPWDEPPRREQVGLIRRLWRLIW